MNIYLLRQDIVSGYDTYDSAVVVAENEDEARRVNPEMGLVTHIEDDQWMGTYTGGKAKGDSYIFDSYAWVKFTEIDKIEVCLLGAANEDQEKGLILASFNAG